MLSNGCRRSRPQQVQLNALSSMAQCLGFVFVFNGSDYIVLNLVACCCEPLSDRNGEAVVFDGVHASNAEQAHGAIANGCREGVKRNR